MADTTSRGYPYPELSDDFTPSADIEALAEAINTDVAALAARLDAIDGGSTKPPLIRLVQGSAQSGTLTDNTAVAVTFTTEIKDDLDWHNNSSNTNRITPSKAGWYRVHAIVFLAARSDYASIEVGIRRNGSTISTPTRVGPNGTSSVRSVENTVFVEVDGVDDYIDCYVNQDNSANAAGSTFVNSSSQSILEMNYEGPFTP